MVAVIALDPLDLVPGAENERRALVQARRLEVHDPLATSGRAAAGLLDDERDRIALIHQPQLPRHVGLLAVLGVQEDTAAGEDAVRLSHQGRNPAHVEVPAPRSGAARQALLDVAAHRRLPEPLVGCVDGELPAVLGDAQLWMGEDEGPDVAVEGESVNALPGGEDQHGARPVQREARAHLSRTQLEEVLRPRLGTRVGAAQDREDRAHRDVGVKVARAVQRIEHQQVLPPPLCRRDGVDVFHLFRRHRGQVPGPFRLADHHLIADEVELLLLLALDVLRASASQGTGERAAVDLVADDLHGGSHRVEQPGEITGGAGMTVLGLDGVPGQRPAFLTHGLPASHWKAAAHNPENPPPTPGWHAGNCPPPGFPARAHRACERAGARALC